MSLGYAAARFTGRRSTCPRSGRRSAPHSSIPARSSGLSTTSAAAAFSSIARRVGPGIGTTSSPCAQHPGQRQLRRRCTPFSGASSSTLRDQRQVPVQVLALETRLVRRKSSGVEVVGRRTARSGSRGRAAVGDEADPQLAARRQHVVAPGPGSTASTRSGPRRSGGPRAPGGSSPATASRQPEVADLALARPARPSRRPSPRSATSGSTRCW